MYCDYGCGQTFQFKLKNGKHCCSKRPSGCPILKKINSEGTKKAYTSGKRIPQPEVYKNLPARMENQLNNIKNYFTKNKLIINDNCKIVGSLEFGGLSNYWGLQLDTDITSDVKNIKKKIRIKIINFFYSIITSLSLLGSLKINKKNIKTITLHLKL